MDANARNTQPAYAIRFGPFELDPRAGELRKHGIRIRLQEKPLQILLMLVERPGEAILRDEIRLRLWPNNTIVEFDHSINAAIKRLRDALGESAEVPRYVETLARRGYRFVGEVDVSGYGTESAKTTDAAMNDSVPMPVVPAEESGDLAGQTICHYRVFEQLGSGSMGVVYRAEDLKLGRIVALKFLPEEMAPDAVAMARFEQEARAASAVHHPNICSIFAVEVFKGRPFIAMELVEGEILASRLSKGPLRLDEVFKFGIQIADALAAAHARGVIHRDLKPENIMVAKSTIKLVDFGIATLGKSAENSPETSAEAGAVAGTLHFLSPEQLEGKQVDARSDIFAFGVLMYQALTARQAFRGDSTAEVIASILHAEPTFDDIPEAPRRIVRACLEKDPEARWQSARDLGMELRWAAAEDDAKSGSRRDHLRRRFLIAAGALAVALALAFWLVPRQRSRAQEPLYRVNISTPRLDVANGSRIAVSRDGHQIAFIAIDESGSRHLAVRSLDADVVQTVARAVDARNDPFWSPDGRFVGYYTTDSLNTVGVGDRPGANSCSHWSSHARRDMGNEQFYSFRRISPHIWNPGRSRIRR
jgi:serine/threonine protein kinase